MRAIRMTPERWAARLCTLTFYTLLLFTYLHPRREQVLFTKQPCAFRSEIDNWINSVMKADRELLNETKKATLVVTERSSTPLKYNATRAIPKAYDDDFVSHLLGLVQAAFTLPLSCAAGGRGTRTIIVEVLMNDAVPNDRSLSDRTCASAAYELRTFTVTLNGSRSVLSSIRSAIVGEGKQASVLIVNVGQCNNTHSLVEFLKRLEFHVLQPTVTLLSANCTDKHVALLMLRHGHCQVRSPSRLWVFWALDWQMQQLFCGWKTVALVP